MKEVMVVRHANWDLAEDKLTSEGRAWCLALRPQLGEFSLVVSSPFGRTQETAELLSGNKPAIDERAGVLVSPPELRARIAELRKTHPLGVAGAIFSIPALREPLQRQGEALKALAQEILDKLTDGQRALIVSHDGTMVALEKILNHEPFDNIDHTYSELEGFVATADLRLRQLYTSNSK